MSILKDKRIYYVRDALRESGGDVDRAANIAEHNYRKFVGRELSFGEVQDLNELLDEALDMLRKADADAYRRVKRD